MLNRIGRVEKLQVVWKRKLALTVIFDTSSE